MKLQHLVVLVGCTILAGSCGQRPPQRVWVGGPGFAATLKVRAGGTSAAVGEWIDLHADRETGPWVEVASKDLAPGTTWLREPPPSPEENVEGNVTWHVDPAGSAEFNLPTTKDLHSRRVRFATAGTFTLWATSHTWTSGTVDSNRLTVTVGP